MMDVSDAILTDHALGQMSKRQIPDADVRRALASPESVDPVRTGRVVAQAVVGEHLLRVFVDIDRDPPEVVTVYRTSKIDKYRSKP
ncbi:MAG: DUF4258 domain-containing protein [Tepidisphaeraceae bacterium]